MKTKSLFSIMLLVATAVAGISNSKAAVVGQNGYTETFYSQPAPQDWATYSYPGASTDDYDLVSVMQTININLISEALVSNEQDPPPRTSLGLWCSSGGYICTRPTGNRATLIAVKLQNLSGTNATKVSIEYDFSVKAAVTEPDYPGQRAFYSLTGESNSWIAIPEFSSSSPSDGHLTAVLNLTTPWLQSNYLYIVWFDDNANMINDDPAYAIDNFSVKITAGTPVAPPITVSIVSPTNNSTFTAPESLSVTANAVSRDGSITKVEFYIDGSKVGEDTESPYEITLQNPSVGYHTITATAYDNQNNSATSDTIRIAVFDPAGTPLVAITSPANGSSFQGPITIPINAIASAPAGISNVLFYANDTLIGESTAEPYSIVWNATFGNITLVAIANGINGLSATSAAVNITVSEPPINTNPPVIVSQEPPAGATLGSLTQIRIVFSEPVINVDASDLLINGVPAKNVSGSGAEYIFTFDQPPYGQVKISWAPNHGITDIGYPSNLPFDATASGATWSYQLVDREPPVIVRRLPAPGDIIYADLSSVTVVFSEPVTGVDASDLLRNGVPAKEVVKEGTTYTFLFDPIEDPQNYSLITISFAENHGITDLAETPNPFDANAIGSKWAYRFVYTLQTGNDNFADRIAITNIPATVFGYNQGATTEPGEPIGSGFSTRGASVWWKWVAPFSGQVRIDTFGSSFNTTLGVFTGTNVSSLTQVAFNDNASGTQQSMVTFNAVQGTEYQIQVCGTMVNFRPITYGMGLIQLNLSMPPSVTITSPRNNSTITNSELTMIAANVTTNVAPIMQVDFYCGDTYVGTVLKPPYTLVSTNFPVGSNTLYAVATDALSQVATASVNVVVLNYGVNVMSPRDGTIYSSPTSIPISVTSLLKAGAITNVEFYVDDVLLGNDDTAPFSISWTNNITPGSHKITAVGYSDDGQRYISTPVYIGVSQTIIDVGAIWKYLDNGVDQGTAWRMPDFDDSSWQSGPSPLGYGDANGQYPATTNSWGPDPNNRYPTYYYRLAFDLTNDLSLYDYIFIYVQRDDGIILYLNGVEIYRQNMPSGEITYTNYALTTVGMNDEVAWYGTIVPTNLFRNGRNVIAAEVHQSDPTSSDIWFNFRMIGIPKIIRNILPEVSLISPTNNVVYIAPETITIEAEASDEDGTVQKVEFYDGSVKLGEISEPPYVFVWTNPPVGWHDIRVAAIDNMGGVRYSSSSLVTIYSAETVPLVQITNPFNGRVWDNLEGYTNVAIQVRASAYFGVTNVVFLADGLEIGSVATPPYSMVWSNVPFGTHVLTAKAFDSNGNFAESAPITITVVEPPINTEAPRIAAVDPQPGSTITNLTTIKITFTERVMGIDASDLLINGSPALSMSGSGSNYTFTVAQPPYGTVTISWAHNHGITDKGYPNNLPFDETDPSATWTYNLIDKVAPYIVNRTPAVGASVSNLNQITITFSERVSGVDASDLLINGNPATEVTTTDNITYTFKFPRPLYGVVTVSWASEHGITDMATEPNAFVPTGNSASWQYILVAPRIQLVATNATYKMLKGLWEPSLPIGAWRLLSYDDAVWQTAQAPFYFDIDKTPVPYTGNTLLDDMYGKYQVIYLRHKFFVHSPQAMTNLTIRARADDGFIAWINGVEIYRSSTVTNGDIPFNYPSNTVSAVSEPSTGLPYVTNVIAVPSSVLVSGENLLAIQAMNRTTNDNDFLIEAELYASAVDPMLIGPMIISVEPPPGNVWSLTNITVKFTEPVANVSANALLINGVPAETVTQIDGITFCFGFQQPPFGTVSVTWSENHGIVDLDSEPKPFNATAPGATFTYRLINPDLPKIVDIDPKPGFVTNYLTGITVKFDRNITNIHSGDMLINGVPALGVDGEMDTYTFSFAQPAYGKVNVSWSLTQAIADESNPSLVFDPTAPGHTWQYLLLDMIPPTIVTQSPPAGAYVSTINYIIVTFSEPVTGVSVGDLLVNGIPSTSVIGQGTSYRFSFPVVNATNLVVTWAPDHGITDKALIPNPFDANAPGHTWSYATEDKVPPKVTRISPAPGSTIKSLNTINVWFSENVTGVDPTDLLVNGMPADSLTGSGSGPYTFSYSLSVTGQVNVAWAPNNGIRDLAATPNYLADGSWSYVINPDLLTHVIHISVDALGALYLRDYIKNAPEQFPNFVRFTKIGAYTLNARCDYFISVTIPNHSSMFTSLPSLQPEGWDNMSYHGVTIDSDNGSTIHSPTTGNPNLPYKYSVFDVVHDNGLSTAFLYSKASLTLLYRSWSGTNGASDLVGEDNGKNKIDYVLSTAQQSSTGSSLPLVEELERRVGSNTLWNYTFMHFTEPDTIGHSYGWGSVTWSNTVRTIDGYLGRVVDAILQSPTYSNQTVIIITADHGGTGMGHSDATLQIDYTIPMFIIGPKIPAGADLYSLFANRVDPGTNRVPYTAPYQPLRDGDVGNLVCTFLGLPYIPNSRIIPIFGTPPVWLNITKTDQGLMISWPKTATDYQLQYIEKFSPQGGEWIYILDGIQTNENTLFYHFINDPNKSSGFFRLIKTD